MPASPRDERSIAEAKAHFAECIRQAESGLEILLTRHGRPVARIVPYDRTAATDPATAVPRGPADEVRERPTTDAAPAPAFRSNAARQQALRELLADEIWPRVPESLRGRAPTKQEREEILGYGARGA